MRKEMRDDFEEKTSKPIKRTPRNKAKLKPYKRDHYKDYYEDEDV